MSKLVRTTAALGLAVGSCAAALAQETTYRNAIRPLFVQKCSGCHGAGSPDLGDFEAAQAKYTAQMKGPRMNSYPEMLFFVGWPDTGAIMRRLDDGKSAKDGKPGNMYQYLGSSEAERQKNLGIFKSWVGPGAWNLKRWEARGDVPAITKEEMDRIRARY